MQTRSSVKERLNYLFFNIFIPFQKQASTECSEIVIDCVFTEHVESDVQE